MPASLNLDTAVDHDSKKRNRIRLWVAVGGRLLLFTASVESAKSGKGMGA